jgi:hypothetical protein
MLVRANENAVADPPLVTLEITKAVNIEALHDALKQAIGGKFVGLTTRGDAGVAWFKENAKEDDLALAATIIAAHDAAAAEMAAIVKATTDEARDLADIGEAINALNEREVRRVCRALWKEIRQLKRAVETLEQAKAAG